MKALTIEDLSVDQAVLAYPMDPGSGTVKKDRAALIVLVRLPPDAIDPAIRPRAAGGILGYSALCTHMACIVDQYTAFGSGQKELRCRCHGSVYDPRRGAVVLDGPAPRPLPAIPLAVRAGKLVVAGDFTGKVGP
ncbi:Rieske 2Fe-2S domain-containing protein [Carboxydochorda subterranea]|uniref:Rieske 2Fe-2S domain-containing protein n=1 Tax=Carboxydichorda subterranea TaxID=3109565 RepID=A0ABZ1BU36_9FIRM|nr:Rieske 2Fe-2S domain-containing protein [Limnochorda sp. L945t]WRP16161.1 Rieske 2Fe-2S domain-containing protein [Limnochorda sp. L945t]